MIIYTGIGSRKAPPEILVQMTHIAYILAEAGFILRSGHAEGSDIAFESGCIQNKGLKEIYLPWSKFNEAPNNHPDFKVVLPSRQAEDIARQSHPVYDGLSRSVQLLHLRNVYQILGENLKTPSKFVLCWTPDGATHKTKTSRMTGGTGQAIRIAAANQVPVFNMFNPGTLDKLEDFINNSFSYS